MTDPETILEYWFGDAPDDGTVAAQRGALWWSKSDAVDEDIRARFETTVQAAGRDELDDWAATARGRLALIILTDQFPRNMYRGTPAAFAFDAKARALCLEGLAAGQDRELRPIQRVFWYMPLEHSEDLAHQDRSVALFRELRDEVGAQLRETFQVNLDFAVRHQEIIQRFGRFPHRNAILGRTSTPEELAFLEEPGSSF
ncbi:DUF924 family protein [Aquisalimonas lutea]|uniref:DUF924 family protein n=1 Tax=Aquisalimonas lutea TaxID=1327750 RepID=UPI0025B52FC2|nr:DUF924 family protein [Aquisalimonas lutea]MDN3519428.1 DUF924 family protein [Aquisalimonas lutea]